MGSSERESSNDGATRSSASDGAMGSSERESSNDGAARSVPPNAVAGKGWAGSAMRISRPTEQGLGPTWLTAMLLVLPLSLLAELLIARTHHRPLGAVTFATVAVLGWVATDILSRRALDASRSQARARARSVAWAVAVLGVVLVLVRSLF